MNLRRALTYALSVGLLGTALETSALASPSAPAIPPASTAPAHGSSSAHASLRLDMARGKAWVGQAVPVTLKAFFRGVEGVTLEGAPQLTSQGVFTSLLAGEPHQATEIVDGQAVLVATWTGTITPSSPGPLEFSATLPVRVRYREAATRTQVQMPDLFQDDPFAALAGNPFDTSMVQRFFEQSAGRLRDESVSLRASARPVDAREPPSEGEPATFSGAVGHFDLHASVSSALAHVSEPITLRVVVEGTGDLDRVELSGVASSEQWKAYPTKGTVEPAVAGKRRARKIFEQVLVPLRGGNAEVPPIALTSFDPTTEKYVTRATAPLQIPVEGTAAPAPIEPPAAATLASATTTNDVATPDLGPLPVLRPVTSMNVALRVAPVALLVLAAGLFGLLRRKRADRTLRRSMRREATRGDAVPFYRAAHALIGRRLSDRWGLRPEQVSSEVIRARLGEEGAPLVEALAADEALRFGRARLEAPELLSLCASIERALGGVS